MNKNKHANFSFPLTKNIKLKSKWNAPICKLTLCIHLKCSKFLFGKNLIMMIGLQTDVLHKDLGESYFENKEHTGR